MSQIPNTIQTWITLDNYNKFQSSLVEPTQTHLNKVPNHWNTNYLSLLIIYQQIHGCDPIHQLLQFAYEIWEIIIHFTTCFSFWRLFYTDFLQKNLERSWTIGRDIFFSAEDYTNMSYCNCCCIRPKHSNISKRVGEGVITICVVLDQSTVIF